MSSSTQLPALLWLPLALRTKAQGLSSQSRASFLPRQLTFLKTHSHLPSHPQVRATLAACRQLPPLVPVSLSLEYPLSPSSLFFFLVFDRTHSVWKFPGLGLNQSHSSYNTKSLIAPSPPISLKVLPTS